MPEQQTRYGRSTEIHGHEMSGRRLEELGTAELGRLFPIVLSEYDPSWPEKFAYERQLIERVLGHDTILRCSHIGSTAVPGLVAKPTIDILLEVREDADPDELLRRFADMGYRYSPQPKNPAPHMMFMKGYTPRGFAGQAYHVHVRYSGDWDEPRFRDFLIRHPETAGRYVTLKRRLKDAFEFDRDAYTRGKTGFIETVMQAARADRDR
jgi:GrpB-like predicted nucleotidyltransferase (UPF0157 family)